MVARTSYDVSDQMYVLFSQIFDLGPDENSLLTARRLCGNVDRLPDSRAQTCRTVKAG
jgi:hypothetical protein